MSVQRDSGTGAILAAAPIPLGIAPEFVPDDNPALVCFLFVRMAGAGVSQARSRADQGGRCLTRGAVER